MSTTRTDRSLHLNSLMARLTPQVADDLVAQADVVSYGPGAVISHAGEPLDHVLFPTTLVISFGSELGGDGLIGSEGLVGWSALTGCELAFDSTVAVLDGGESLRLPAGAVKAACLLDPMFFRVLLRFAQSVAVQMSTTIGSLRSDDVETRLARWLVMLHDRRPGDGLPMTHERLAELLGVRRASVTDTLHRLEGEHLVRGTRGHVQIRDRAGLIQRAGRYYGDAERIYDELMHFDRAETSSSFSIQAGVQAIESRPQPARPTQA